MAGSHLARLADYKTGLAVLEVEANSNAAQQEIASFYDKIGDEYFATGNFAETLLNYGASHRILQDAFEADNYDFKRRRELLTSQSKVSTTLRTFGNFEEAVIIDVERLTIAEQILELEPHDLHWRHYVAKTLFRIWWSSAAIGDMSVAEKACDRGVKIMKKLTLLEPSNKTFRSELEQFEGAKQALRFPLWAWSGYCRLYTISRIARVRWRTLMARFQRRQITS